MSDNVVLTVTALNRYVKSLLDSDVNLQTVYVKGEISNFKAGGAGGHFYMTIKDENSRIRAAMFRSANSRLKFMPENDMSVIIRGRVSLYEQGGEYQLIIDDMQPDGAGALAAAFEQLKKKLAAEGVFDEAHKKPIPAFPERVGVVTSGTGAAVRDIINVISRRYPVAEIIVCPVSVQGENAKAEISSAINLFNEKKAADVIIVGRGGGSVEDLWAFNEELVARAVYASEIPVISAVGHETDFTICDFAADLRAPTPSAAAELAVPDSAELTDSINALQRAMYAYSERRIAQERSKLGCISSLIEKNNPKVVIESYFLRIDYIYDSLKNAAGLCLERNRSKLNETVLRLDACSPLKIMSKGYAVAVKGSRIVKSVTDTEPGDEIDLKLADGTARCEVKEVWKK